MQGHEKRRLSTNKCERPAAPDDVWSYGQFTSWRDDIWTLIDDFADSAVRQEFLRAAPEYLVSDDLSWLDDIVFRVHGEEIDSKAQLAERLRTRYRALRAYHGTAANSLDSFYSHGLRPLDIAEFHDRARRIFLGGQFPELSEANLLAAIEEVGAETREGRVFFEANEELLVEMCGHYLLYGSEYLVALAAHLGEHEITVAP